MCFLSTFTFRTCSRTNGPSIMKHRLPPLSNRSTSNFPLFVVFVAALCWWLVHGSNLPDPATSWLVGWTVRRDDDDLQYSMGPETSSHPGEKVENLIHSRPGLFIRPANFLGGVEKGRLRRPFWLEMLVHHHVADGPFYGINWGSFEFDVMHCIEHCYTSHHIIHIIGESMLVKYDSSPRYMTPETQTNLFKG